MDDIGARPGATWSPQFAVHLSPRGFTPVRSAHPVRAKDDRDGQVSWLAGHR